MKEEMMEKMPGLEVEIQMAEEDDEQSFDGMAPEGQYSVKPLNNLVKAANRLLPLFDQTPDYPAFSEDLTKLPTDFVRVLAMFEGAISDAVEKDMVDEEMQFELEDITDDAMLNVVAGKVNSIASSKDFKRYLKEVPSEMGEEMEMNEEVETEDEEPTEEDVDTLFMERM
jgi:hypothetical protein